MNQKNIGVLTLIINKFLLIPFNLYVLHQIVLVKNLGKTDFRYLSQEFDKVLDLVKQKGFYLYEYVKHFEKFKELSSKKNLQFITGKKKQ